MNLNLGCGPNRESLNVITLDWAGWKFIDVWPEYNPDECYDISQGIREPDHSVETIWLGDCLEHCVKWRQAKVLAECYRVLVPGGKLLISVPDMAIVMPRWLAGEAELDGLIWGHQDERGGGNEVGDTHRFGYVETSLKAALKLAGFQVARRIGIHNVWYELAVEAVK
jgi:SAM-dependent methyltransferase